jgi:hypothetical protein
VGRDGTLTPYLSFNDPNRYPEIFTLESRYERWHLNEDGALTFSRILGAELAVLVGTGPGNSGNEDAPGPP